MHSKFKTVGYIRPLPGGDCSEIFRCLRYVTKPFKGRERGSACNMSSSAVFAFASSVCLLVLSQGVMGLYRGLGPNFLKALPAIAISYAVYEKARTKLSSFVPKQGSNGRRILVGGESS